MKKNKQLSLDLRQPGRGGVRPGAGRPARPGAEVLHRQREKIPVHCPVHVTVRVKRDVPRLRLFRFVRAFRSLLSQCCYRSGFRVIHYSIQKDHIHMIVEAQGKRALANGMKSVNARLARAVNRIFHRQGSVLRGRFHSRVLRTPREVRHALAYVLLNIRHHLRSRGRTAPPNIDEASSGVWFNGWKTQQTGPPTRRREVARAGTWLLNVGWRKHRLISLAEVPAAG